MVYGNLGLMLLIGLGVWVIVLTGIVIRMYRHYNRLTTGITTTGLRNVLESLLAHFEEGKARYRDIDGKLKELGEDGTGHIQRVGFVRFNPFSDTGGAQSFTIAILDGNDNGIVMTSLYARAGNRWYIKEVIAGKGKEVAISKEEEAAIRKARV